MTIAEAEQFYKQDQKEYRVNDNLSFLTFFVNLKKKGYHSLLEVGEMQDFISRIQNWYEMKYPDRELDAIEGITHTNFKDIRTLSAVMDTRQFLYRLPHRQLYFLEGGYRSTGWGCDNTIFMSIKGRPDYTELYAFTYTPSFMIHADQTTGEVKPTDDLGEILGEDSFSQNKKITLDQLYDVLKNKIGDIFDLTELKNSVFFHNCDTEIRNRLLQLAALQLLYSRNTTPEKGYFRAKKFIEEFNQSFGLQLSAEQIDEIMSRDYSGVSTKKENPIQYFHRFTRLGKKKGSKII